MTLDDSQKQTVRQWIEEGLKVADIQVKLAEEFDITMTYMEVRFLVDDLGVIPKDPEPEVEKEEPAPPPNDAPQPSPAEPAPEENLGELVDDEATAPQEGNVQISLDQLARPGMLASGKVTFSDQQTAGWHLDQFGQLGLSPDQEGYKPSQTDLMEFQVALQSELSKKGF